jgi:hypothetical protein
MYGNDTRCDKSRDFDLVSPYFLIDTDCKIFANYKQNIFFNI